jgi:hypothetical protein
MGDDAFIRLGVVCRSVDLWSSGALFEPDPEKQKPALQKDHAPAEKSDHDAISNNRIMI